MKIIIIPCSGKKRDGGTESYKPPQLAMILGEEVFRKLLMLRNELSALLNLPPGPDIGGEQEEGIEFRAAFDRYDGKMYQTADFRRLYPGFQGRVFIISALYGLLDADDHIRNYNLAMNYRLPSGEGVWHWWKRKGLQTHIETALGNTGVTEVHDLLSELYRKAIGHLISDNQYQVHIYTYPGQGTGSLYRRGEDLKRLLTKRSRNDC